VNWSRSAEESFDRATMASIEAIIDAVSAG
jgi:hypothetical protein